MKKSSKSTKKSPSIEVEKYVWEEVCLRSRLERNTQSVYAYMTRNHDGSVDMKYKGKQFYILNLETSKEGWIISKWDTRKRWYDVATIENKTEDEAKALALLFL